MDTATSDTTAASTPTFILGTAGHIDHGKSTLVHALTGVDPDRLAQEKERGITIELGFASLDLGDGTTCGVVDVPGHEKFVRQMISGASGIDVALICIAADDGIMPQTIEHLAVLELLGIHKLIVALTKCDLVDDEWIDMTTTDILEYLSSTRYAESPIVSVSARDGSGLDKLKGTLRSFVGSGDFDSRVGETRMPIDRVFNITGSGCVVTGTLWQGTVRSGDVLEILPAGISAKVRGVQVHGISRDFALPHNRVALNLAGVKKSDIHPGDFLATQGFVTPSVRFDATFTYHPSCKNSRAIESGSWVLVSHGTREVRARILFFNERTEMKVGETDFAQLRLDFPLPISSGDHFILRSTGTARVIGGGRAIISNAHHSSQISQDRLDLLNSRINGDEAGAVRCSIRILNGPGRVCDFADICGLDLPKVWAVLEDEVKGGHLVRLAEGAARADFAREGANASGAMNASAASTDAIYVEKSLLQKQLSKLESALMNFHLANPASASTTKANLFKLANLGISASFQDAYTEYAAHKGAIVISGAEISHHSAGAGAAAKQKQDTLDILDFVASAETPCAIPEIAEGVNVEGKLCLKLANKLVQSGEVVRIAQDMFMSKSGFDKLVTQVRSHISEFGPSKASDLKDAMGLSRKYAIPVLECMDAQGITVRDGELRTCTSKTV